MSGRKRITLVTDEILGVVRTAGAATANTSLAFALARLGHHLEILLTGEGATAELDRSWAAQYAERGIEIRRVVTPSERVGHAFASTYAVQETLRSDPPELVIAHDCYAPGYAPLRSRDLGLAFTDTVFAIYCHGTTGWTYEAHQKLRRWPPSFEFQMLERASIELADVVVSPSAYMLDWMRGRRWTMRRTVVAPYFTRSVSEVNASSAPGRIRRIVFFGRLEERKGIAPFVEAVNGLEPKLAQDLEILFLGRDTSLWPVARVRAELNADVAAVRFETDLDQPEAIRLLQEPGTLAVMPSLVDNSPNVVYECLQHGVPFLASKAGGGPELVVAEDRPLAFVEPTASAIRLALERAIAEPDAVRLPRAAFDRDELLETWEEIVTTTVPARTPRERRRGRVDTIVHGRARLDEQLRATSGEYVLLTAEGDELDDDCIETLLRAAAHGADVVTCGVRAPTGPTRLFLGEARELGLIGNYYGLVGLYRRSVLEGATSTDEIEGDEDWVLLARLSLAGAKIASVPFPLATSARAPGTAGSSQASFAVLQAFEHSTHEDLVDLPWLAASLAAVRASRVHTADGGVSGVARRGARRAARALLGRRA